ncbi:hypothetical protein OF897_05940 [Chryseobacterium formosus]|uniref:Uncharacterized protein n=1 Tax=Chryseobacterium formosus TaxID=1537363 RepID=A0ABT3XPM7_9FLAO|nr:hypothetical protein [Chryseobacterium formosus]MCX8523457.1 hypothetical protein [Chryseobacterium formosus]
MKKIILGLFFTVGISGIALANNLIPIVSEHKMETKVITKENGDKKQVITYNYVNGVLFSCTIAIHTQIKDNCGYVIGTRKESYEASGGACNGIEGGLAIYRKTEHLLSGNCHSFIEKLQNSVY